MAIHHRPSFSVIIESENLAVEDSGLLLAALDSLHRQSVPISDANEAILVNSGKIPADVEALIAERYPTLKLHTIADGSTYYEAKQDPVALTTGNVIVFCDCDCRYDPQWLEAILAPHTDPTILANVVTGETSVALEGFHSYFIALNWCFPIDKGRQAPFKTDGYPANNVSFARELLQRHPLPTALRLYRGNCSLHARQLLDAGVSIWKAPRARAIHPTLRPSHVPARFFMWGHHEARVCRARYENQANPVMRTINHAGSLMRIIARRVVMPFVRWPALLRQRPGSILVAPALLVYIALTDLLFIAGAIVSVFAPSMSLLQLGRTLEASEHG